MWERRQPRFSARLAVGQPPGQAAMKKFLKWTGITVLGLFLLGYGYLWYSTIARNAAPAPEALAALVSDERVTVSEDGWLVFRPNDVPPTTGVILYPGANCDVRGYAPVLRRLAEQGYLVVNVAMPFDFAIFAPNRALQVVAAHPEIRRWVLIGHSMGGAMAGQFVHSHPTAVDGLVFWDAYPPDSASLADLRMPVWLIHRATPAGEPPEHFARRRPILPPDTRWVPIAGGNHMNFGAFSGGAYQEQWEATISREDQHEQVFAATLAAVQTVEAL